MNDLVKEKLKSKEYLELYKQSLKNIEKIEKDINFRQNEKEKYIEDNIRELEEISDKEKIDYFDERYTIMKYKLLELFDETDGLNYEQYMKIQGKYDIFAKHGKNIYDFLNKII